MKLFLALTFYKMIDDSIKSLLSQTNNYSSSGDFINEIKIYKKVLEIDGKNIDALTNLSHLYIQLEMNEEAQQTARKAYSLYRSNDERVVANYACILIEDRQILHAINILEDAKSNGATDYLIYNNLGFAYHQLCDHENALENLNISIALEENNPLAYCNRGILKYSIFNKGEGIKDLHHAHLLGDLDAGSFLQTIAKDGILLS